MGSNRLRRRLCLATLGAIVWLFPGSGAAQSSDPQMDCFRNCPLVGGAFGKKDRDPACVKKCLLLEDPLLKPAGGQFADSWQTTERFRKQKQTVSDYLSQIDGSREIQ